MHRWGSRVREWIDRIPNIEGGSIKVEKRDLGIRVGKVDMSRPPAAVMHTTETDHIDISWGNGAAHIALGNHSGEARPVLQQTIPFGWMATALANPAGGVETNRWARLQVECAWFSSLDPYLPSREEQVLWASLAEFAEKELGIPEKRPWPDVLDRGPQAVTSYYRRQSKWGSVPGFYKHAEVTENHHWDDGSMRQSVLLRIEPKPEMVEAYTLVASWRTKGDDPHRERVDISPHFARRRDLEDWMARDEAKVRKVVREHLFTKFHTLKVARREIDADKVRS